MSGVCKKEMKRLIESLLVCVFVCTCYGCHDSQGTSQKAPASKLVFDSVVGEAKVPVYRFVDCEERAVSRNRMSQTNSGEFSSVWRTETAEFVVVCNLVQIQTLGSSYRVLIRN